MNPPVVIEMLEEEWRGISESLEASEWDAFAASYRHVVSALPLEPSWQDLDAVVVQIREQMMAYSYTRGLWFGWQDAVALTASRFESAEQVLRANEELIGLGNRFRALELAEAEPHEPEAPAASPPNSTAGEGAHGS